VKPVAAVAGRLEKGDQLPGADQHAMAASRAMGSLEIDIGKRRFSPRLERYGFVMRDVLQLAKPRSLCGHGNLLQDGCCATIVRRSMRRRGRIGM